MFFRDTHQKWPISNEFFRLLINNWGIPETFLEKPLWITPVRLDVEQHQLFRSIDNLGFFVIALEHKRDGRFLEQSGGKDLQNCVERMLKAQSFFDNGDQDINSNGNPNLGLDAVRGSAEETFDPKVLFDPFEKEFDMPAVAINGGDGQRR